MFIFEILRLMLQNEKGQGLVEYELILAVIAVVVIGIISTMGTNLATFFLAMWGQV